MNFRIEDHSTDNRFIVKVIFDSDITSYFTLDNYDVVVVALGNDTSRSLENRNNAFGEFGLTATCPDSNRIIDESLINNKGIVMFLAANNELDIYILPRCVRAGNTIGFNNCIIKINCGYDKEEILNIEINSILYPKIVRESDIYKVNPAEEDPILPNMVESRSCYTYSDISTSGIVDHNIIYNTEDSLFVNTYSGVDYIDDDMDPSVPMYISKLSAYLAADDNITFDNAVIESYLYNNLNNTQLPIDYNILGSGTLEKDVISASYYDEIQTPYKSNINYYEIEQLITTTASGYFKNELTFNISALLNNNE